MNRSIECVFAEYQKELLENYDVFAIEAGYETGRYSEQNILDRLSYYGADMENEITRIQLLTDKNGELFMDQVGKYMKHKYGISWADKYLGSTSLWKNQEQRADEFMEEEKTQTDYLEELLGEQDMELPSEENPMEHIALLKHSPLLDLVMPEGKQVSEKQLDRSDMPENRENERGHGTFEDVEAEEGRLSTVMMGEYVLEHFVTFSDDPKGGSLDYEVEYILAGKESDKENLESVAKKLVLLRFVPNYIYLQTNSVKQAEARAAAGTLCTLLAVPAIKQGIYREANQQIVKYSESLASQGAELSKAQGEAKESGDVAEEITQQLDSVQKKSTSYQALLNAYVSYTQSEYDAAALEIQKVYENQLGDDVMGIYNTICSATGVTGIQDDGSSSEGDSSSGSGSSEGSSSGGSDGSIADGGSQNTDGSDAGYDNSGYDNSGYDESGYDNSGDSGYYDNSYDESGDSGYSDENGYYDENGDYQEY